MKYLPILQELFESDTIVFLIIWIVFAVIAGLWLKNRKRCVIGVALSIALYVICELVSNFHTNFLLEIVLVFAGTAAIGCCIGFLLSLVFGALFPRK